MFGSHALKRERFCIRCWIVAVGGGDAPENALGLRLLKGVGAFNFLFNGFILRAMGRNDGFC